MSAVWSWDFDTISNIPISADLESKRSAFVEIIYIHCMYIYMNKLTKRMPLYYEFAVLMCRWIFISRFDGLAHHCCNSIANALWSYCSLALSHWFM